MRPYLHTLTYSFASLHLHGSTNEVSCVQLGMNPSAFTFRQNKHAVNQVDFSILIPENHWITENRDLFFKQNAYEAQLNKKEKRKQSDLRRQSTMKQTILSLALAGFQVYFLGTTEWYKEPTKYAFQRLTHTRNIRLSLKVQPEVVWPSHTLSAF